MIGGSTWGGTRRVVLHSYVVVWRERTHTQFGAAMSQHRFDIAD